VIAGTHSGVGKTTITIGIMSALKKRGLSIQPFKVGPDFIDPGYHELVCKVPSRNLDSWMLDTSYNRTLFLRHSRDKDIALVEGVMGLYDGSRTADEDGSTAHMAKLLKAPVILVVDAKGMSRSVAAVVCGFEHYDKQLQMPGVILNRVGSKEHYDWLKQVIEEQSRTRVLGYLPPDETVRIPERHLGLLTTKENSLNRTFIGRIRNLVEHHIDLDLLVKMASPIAPQSVLSQAAHEVCDVHEPAPVRIAVAYDKAFCFYYQDNLDLLRHWGAHLTCFSPLKESSLPDDVDGIYIGGGYPELFASDLAANRALLKEIKRFAECGGTIYAECGGLMYLGKYIKGFDNTTHKMVGLFPFTTVMHKKLTDLGYYTVKSRRSTILTKRGDSAKGHQFRYSSIEGMSQSTNSVFSLRKDRSSRVQRGGFTYKNVLASYVHLHFGSNSTLARRFVASCKNSSRKG
jgi:cobyrinic acid a,c-diamide synthase